MPNREGLFWVCVMRYISKRRINYSFFVFLFFSPSLIVLSQYELTKRAPRFMVYYTSDSCEKQDGSHLKKFLPKIRKQSKRQHKTIFFHFFSPKLKTRKILESFLITVRPTPTQIFTFVLMNSLC